jgi:hypothetical protein
MSMPRFRYSLSARGESYGRGAFAKVALYRELYPVSIGSEGSAAHSESEAS